MIDGDEALDLHLEAQKTKLEGQHLASKAKRLDLELMLLEVAKKMIDMLDSNADDATRSAIAQSLPSSISRLTNNVESRSVSPRLQGTMSQDDYNNY